jgi:ABC-type glycerol-3-phosphate transport system substrate-binding protein
LAEKSTTLLIGERGTKKTVLALQFLAAGVSQQQRSLLISLKDDKNAIHTVIKSYDYLKKHLNEEDDRWIWHIRPCYMGAGSFIDKLIGLIRSLDQPNGKIQRVVFDNLAQLKICFPLLSADQMFLPTLADLLKTEGITSLFIDVVEEPGKAVWEYKSPFLDLADYVIATQHLPFLGKDHTVITVRRSMEGMHDIEPAEVLRQSNKIYVNDHAFDGITGVLERKPKPAEIFLRLFYENAAEKKFNKEIIKEFAEKYKRKVHISSFSRADSTREYGRIKRYWIESPSSIVKVVSLDEYWVKYAAHESILWPINQEWFADEEGEGWLNREKNDFLSAALAPALIQGNLFAVPNYTDLGLFCCRKDLLKKLFGITGIPKLDTFKALISFLKNSGIRKTKRYWGFGFDMETEESLVCTFLEFLSNTESASHKVGDTLRGLLDRGECDPLSLWNDASIVKATVEVFKMLKELVDNHLMPFPCTLQHCKYTLFSRHWYSTLRFIQDECCRAVETRKNKSQRLTKPTFVIMPFPALGQNANTPANNLTHYCCSGSWYLGILKESLRPKLGYHLIDEITSVCGNSRRYEANAGFPTRKSFYVFHADEPVNGVGNLKYREIRDAFERTPESPTNADQTPTHEFQLPRRKIIRREIVCGNNVELYRTTRPKFAQAILGVLTGRLDPEQGADEIKIAIHTAYDELKKRTNS